MGREQLSQDDIRYITNVLREATTRWSGRRIALEKARKQFHVGTYKNGKPKFKFYWQCAECKVWFKDVNQIEVDHWIEIGPFTGDWNDYISKVYCGQDNLRCLCLACHLKKTLKYNSARSRFKRKVKGTDLDLL